MRWEKVVIDFEGYPQKIYVSQDKSQAIVFPAFGRYYTIWSDKSALDLAITIIFHSTNKEISYTQYLSAQEDTSAIFLEAA